MEVKQIDFDNNRMINENSIKHLIFFVHNLEEKLLSVETIHDKLFQLMAIVSKTHQIIIKDLINVKAILNPTTIEQEEDEIISIDATKSEWDDDDDDDDDDDNEEIQSRKLNKNVVKKENLILNSASSNDSSSTNKRSSSLKKSDQSSLTIKSPKSVSFNIEKNIHNQRQRRIITPFHQFSKEKKNEIITPIIPSLSSNLSKQNQLEIKANTKKILTNIRIHEIESKNGDYLRLLNISNSIDYDLSEHFLQQNIHSKPICRFQFPYNTIIRAGQTITIWCGLNKGINPQPPYVFLWKEQLRWETKPECITILAKPNGQSIAWYQNSSRVHTDQSSSDILFVHSKSNRGSSDISSTSSTSIKSASHSNTRQSRFSSFNIFGNNKPPFAHSPNNPIHPDHNGINVNKPNDIRSQMHQRGGIIQLLNRPKSSPFANHTGYKQDLISINLLRTQRQKQTKVKT